MPFLTKNYIFETFSNFPVEAKKLVFQLHIHVCFNCSLRENCQSVGQNRQISEMFGEFFSLPDSMSDEKL